MKYTVNWFRFPNGKETDEMVANSRTYATFDQALRFLQGRVRLISSRHWAGGYIEEDESPCRTVYEIDWEFNEEDLRCENAAEQETMPEGQRSDEDLLAYIERVDPELFASLNHLAESASISNPEQEEISEDIRPPPY
ncbi:MAG: hypothetical protein K2H29_02865 [Oscillospiraceae bacterium]|nr:hypothetical protein [Oscillospiraceae bacterium]